MDRHELDGGDAEREQMRDDGPGGDTRVCAAQFRRNVRVQHGHAAHMGLVDDRRVGGMTRPALAAPVEGRVDHDAERRERRAVALVEHQVAVGIADLIAEQLIGPLERPADALGVGIEQQLVGIEAQPGVRIVRAVHAVAVQLPRSDLGQVQVPGPVGALADPDAGLVLARGIEQAQLDGFRTLGEQREVDAATVPRGSTRKRQAGRLMRSLELGGGGCHWRGRSDAPPGAFLTPARSSCGSPACPRRSGRCTGGAR